MKKIDICFFSEETDLLLKRFKYYKDYVDVFYVFEADKNFYGKKRKLKYPSIKVDIDVKIEYIICKNLHEIDDSKNDYTYTNGPWENEFKFRQTARNIVEEVNDDDIICISDVDEFYNRDYLVCHDKPLTFLMTNNYFRHDYIQYNKSNNTKYLIPGTQMFTKNQYKNFKNTEWDGQENHCFDVQGMRNSPNAGFKQIIKDNAWHFSYFGGIKNIKNKLNNFSHCEYKHISQLSDEEINKHIFNFEDLLGRDEFSYKIENNLTSDLLKIINK